jgi:hypothetical protein
MAVSGAGIVSGLHPGEATVAAAFAGRPSRRTVFVVPNGTFHHRGSVYDDDVPVREAQAAVIGGPATGLVAMTGADGQYRFYGVSGDTEIRITKPGYLEQRKRLVFTSHDQGLQFNLQLSGSRADVTGTYRLTFSAAPECASSSNLPAEVRTRSYDAILEQNGPRVKGTLQGATFHTVGTLPLNTFDGFVEPQGLRFEFLFGTYYSYPSVVERLGSTLFSFAGTAVLTGEGSHFSGTLNGVVGTLSSTFFEYIRSCKSSGHRFELRR